MPTTPAQIHVPAVVVPVKEQVGAAATAARTVAGLTLFMGAAFLLVCAFDRQSSAVTAVVLPATWVAALALAGLAAVRARRSAPSTLAVKLSWTSLFVGLALCAPLTIHEVTAAPAWAPRFWSSLREWPEWVRTTAMLTTQSHVLFAILLGVRGFRGRGPSLPSIWIATVAVTALDCVVWSVYGLLPTAYVAVTAIPILVAVKHLEKLRRYDLVG